MTGSGLKKFVDLGFLGAIDKEQLTSPYFPSKAGGKPAWLDYKNIPDSEQLKCNNCQNQMIFLLQIYTPNDDNENSFHRTVYVFCCKEESCHTIGSGTGCFKVFRNQLKEINDFYYINDEEEPAICKKEGSKLCCVCGCKGEKVCGQCKIRSYCSEEHQKWDWKFNNHKVLCNCDGENLQGENSFLWPEFNIEIDSEDVQNDSDQDDDTDEEDTEEAEARRMEEYKNIVEMENNIRIEKGESEKIDEAAVPFDEQNFKKDDVFLSFTEAMHKNPDQVLRYLRDCPEGALWISDEDIPNEGDIPPCPHCHGKRQLEFQILPQLLNYMKSNLDWGVVAIYTCSNSCTSLQAPYISEHVHRQFVSVRPAVELLKD